MFEKLTDHPWIGCLSGLGSGALVWANDLITGITNVNFLSLASACGVVAGSLVAVLTAILKGMEIVERIKSKK